MGTALQALELTAADYGGETYDGCHEHLVLTRPDIILEVHRQYLAVGVDIVETNSFGGSTLVLVEYGLERKVYEINRRAAELARQACAEFDTPDRICFVAGSMGPTTKAISVTGGVTFQELVDTYREQARGLIDGGADYLLLETCQDTRNVKAGLLGIQELAEELGRYLPVAVSITVELGGTMLAGQTVEALTISLAHEELLYLGLNCATGPELMTDHLRALSGLALTPTACIPNAGLPDEDGKYPETPEMMAETISHFVERGWLNLLGGCCGTTPEHARALVEVAGCGVSRPIPRHRRALYSGIDWIESTTENRPLLVGERTNVIGSRKFKRLISEERLKEAAEIARTQVKNGAQIIDICLANPDRNEREDMERFLSRVVRRVKVPLMIDSTSPAVIEAALRWCQGKSIINSINLEDGEVRFAQVAPLAHHYGAALIVGTIDEQGMAVTRERKLAVARRAWELLTGKYGVPPQDIIFDPLTFPCATGDENYLGAAKETIEGLCLIKEVFPECRTILGLSNVSFGLPPAGREVLNSVFLYECTRAGLDLAIVNTEKLKRYASISKTERKLAEKLLFHTDPKRVAAFADHFRQAKPGSERGKEILMPDEQLVNCLVEGSQAGLVEALEKKLKNTAPLKIINGPLMAGMDEVGRLFNENRLIVAEVLQSAEVMKVAVDYLKPRLDVAETGSRGKVVLATVKGDVHDIGKNLVEIILSNNGYQVIDLGIKVPPREVIAAVQNHKPDLVGLSGLLVRSARMMVETAEELTAAGVTPDLLVGGAALTRGFSLRRIAPAYGGNVLYARDVMQGLALVNRLRNTTERKTLLAETAVEERRFMEQAAERPRVKVVEPSRELKVTVLETLPAPPDMRRHLRREVVLNEFWEWVNPHMLYGKHLGFRGDFQTALRTGDERAQKLTQVMDELHDEARERRLAGRAVWQWFRAASDGDTLRLYRPGSERPAVSWELPRQPGGGLCLTDYIRPADAEGKRDHVALFMVTAGIGIRAWAETLKQQGAYLKSHALQALGLEAAEGLAEWLHAQLRSAWGFPDPPTLTMAECFRARYRGKRYSPGFPACPDLNMQKGIWELLRPQELGVHLTSGYMMDPEASVSAIVFHHPEARYFSAK